MNKHQNFIIALLFIVCSLTLKAQIRLPKLISNGVVLQRDVETGHRRVGDWQNAAFAGLHEEGNHGSAAAHHIAVTHHGKAHVARTADIVGGGEQLVRTQLGGAIKVYWICSLVSR